MKSRDISLPESGSSFHFSSQQAPAIQSTTYPRYGSGSKGMVNTRQSDMKGKPQSSTILTRARETCVSQGYQWFDSCLRRRIYRSDPADAFKSVA